MNLMGELMILRGELKALADQLGAESLQDAVERAGRFIGEMQAHVVESRMVPVWQIFDRFPRLVRDSSRSVGKEIELVISGKQLELDRSLLDAISDPLVHLLRNAVDHGIEPPDERDRAGKPQVGRIELTARRERSRVVIIIRDDGRGIDRDSVIAKARRDGLLGEGEEPTDQLLFRVMARPGFSTATQITTLSGRGVGLDVVEATIRGLGGSVGFRSEPGAGTSFRLDLPLTLAILRALIVEVDGQVYALPATFTRESFEVEETAVERAHGREWVHWRGERVPLTRLRTLFFSGGERNGTSKAGACFLNLVGLEFGESRLVVSVDEFLGEEEIVIKPFDPPRGAVPVFSGAIVRPDGRPALVLDVGNLS
jgi:two-component system chemotaxis sensor kinase CheA